MVIGRSALKAGGPSTATGNGERAIFEQPNSCKGAERSRMLPRMHRCKRVSGRRQGDLMTDENAGEKGKSNIRRRKEERKEESKRVTKGFWDLREKRHKRRRKRREGVFGTNSSFRSWSMVKWLSAARCWWRRMRRRLWSRSRKTLSRKGPA
jgi:hypothetical protein